MIRVKNRKVIRQLSIKSFSAAKIRNTFAIIAIALTTVLFTSLFTISIGLGESFQNQTIRQSGGSGHAAMKYITDEQYNKIKDHPLIKEISYNRIISFSVDNPEFLKRKAEMYYMDETGMDICFCEPTTGRSPVAENEIITDTKTLDLLGIPHELGAVVPVAYTMKGKQYKTDFILSGYWESDPILNVGFVIVSRKFVDAHTAELEYTYRDNYDPTGAINSYIRFDNSFNMEDKLYKVIRDSGYTVPSSSECNAGQAGDVSGENASADSNSGGVSGGNDGLLPTDIECNVNWAYLSSNFSDLDPGSIAVVVMALALIIFTGYLIIYNIFQISVLRDIRYYGLLKTIGTTSRQLKKVVTFQAVVLSVIGIPIGLVIGFITGRVLLPLVVSVSNYEPVYASVSANPVIFAGAALFSSVTVWISNRRPGRLAARVSPVEAVRYNDNDPSIRKNLKRSTDGGKLWKMALSNLGRNKKRTVIVIISISLSLVLLNSAFTFTNGFDMDKFLSKFVDTDFLIGHANYFNMNHLRFDEDSLSESFISAVEGQEGFEDGGRLYYNIHIGQCSIYRDDPNGTGFFGYPYNKAADGQPYLDLYGLEDLPLSRLDIVEGELDIEKLKTGKYILEGVHDDDNGNIYSETSHYKIGDKVKIAVDGTEYEYEVMAKLRINQNTISNRAFDEFAMYLPASEYLRIVKRPVIMSYAFNVANDREAEMEAFIKNYTETVEPMMNYESKQVYIKNFDNMQNMFVTVGGFLCFFIGLIGILNFINSMLTGIITRRHEFAMLQSIGMTGKQLNLMLCCEGLYYAVFTMILSLILGVFVSVVIINGIAGNLWFFTYQLMLSPLLISYPALILLSLAIPFAAYRAANRQSIVERLREAE